MSLNTPPTHIRGLSRNAVNCPSHPTVPWDHGITWDCPSHSTVLPRDVHLSLYRCMCPTVHPIPRSHGIVGHSTGCPPVPLTDTWISYCPSHPTVPWVCEIDWRVTFWTDSKCFFINNICIINIFVTLSASTLSCILNLAWHLLRFAQSACQSVSSRLWRSANLTLIPLTLHTHTHVPQHSTPTHMSLTLHTHVPTLMPFPLPWRWLTIFG